jgi:4-amino-4-deoxy-L-arabinose transferase-like glycosyltransferase
MNEGFGARVATRVVAVVRPLRRMGPAAAVLGAAGLVLLGMLEIIGPCVWDPVELDIAEVARARVEGHGTIFVWGAPGISEPPAVSAIAASFRALGMSAWAGRLPMLAFGVLGAAATFLFASRFFSRRAGVFTVLVLATAPIYFAHARTMTGEIVPLASIACAFAGFGLATFGRATSATFSSRRRVFAIVLAVAFGLLAASSRGLLVGVVVPALAVGLAWAFSRDTAEDARYGRAVLAIGVAASLFALVAVFVSNDRFVSFALGHAAAPSKHPTFDAPIGQIVYAFFPWSALLPLALTALGRTVPRGADAGPRVATLLGVVLSMAAHAALAPRTGLTPLAGASFLALAMGITLANLDVTNLRVVSSSAVATMLGIAYLVTDDLSRAPEKILEPFALAQATGAQAFPAAFGPTVVRDARMAAIALVPFAVIALLAPQRPSLAFVTRHRGTILLIGGVLSGLFVRVTVYPALFSRVAPESALSAYGKKHLHGEKLGLLGVSRRGLAYVRGAPDAVTVADPSQAADFLAPPSSSSASGAAPSSDHREWLALNARDLPQVNALFRARRGRNTPVLAGRTDNILLAVSELRDGEKDESPLSGFVLDGPPKLSRAVHATFADRFEALAWDLTDDDGASLSNVSQRSSFHFKIALGVKQPTPGGYCTFIHIDHVPTRVSMEHKDFAVYPMNLWRAGDVIVDDFPVKLPAHFGRGTYRIHFGVGVLPCEDDRRMPLTSGANDGRDRLDVGSLEVR